MVRDSPDLELLNDEFLCKIVKNNLKICRFGLKEVYSLIEQGNFNLSEISKLADLISSK